GLVSAPTPASSLGAAGRIATFSTVSAHGLLPKSAVLITGAIVGTETSPSPFYNGFFEVLEVPPTPSDLNGRPTTFTYKMSGSPGGPAVPGTAAYAEYWRLRRLVIEANIVELTSSSPPLSPST